MTDQPRTEYGFERTACACASCSIYCRSMPGMLAPSDLARLTRHLGYGEGPEAELRFGLDHLAASPGALVIANGQLMRIHTLVPNLTAKGCHWLDQQGKCSIHAVAPFGCAFYGSHMASGEGSARTAAALEEIVNADQHVLSLYTVLWELLDSIGQTVKAPEVARGIVPDGFEIQGTGAVVQA